MSRRDVEDLVNRLRELQAATASPDVIQLEMPLFNQAFEGLQRLEQALDNRPSLIKKLNEKIIKLGEELEILRNQTRVKELEKKVTRLEGELQRSYATKNFTLKQGLLDIEKAWREFIISSPEVQALWDEVTLLLVEDKDSVPHHMARCASRRHPVALAQRGSVASSAAGAAPASAMGSAPASGNASPMHRGMAQVSEGTTVSPVYESPTLMHASSIVQRNVDKFKDYTFTPGPLDAHDPSHPANMNHQYQIPHYFPGHPGAAAGGGPGAPPDARAIEAMPDDVPAALARDGTLSHLRQHYGSRTGTATGEGEAAQGQGHSGEALAGMQPHWGGLAPVPSPLRPVSLFNPAGTADASALDECRDELQASLEQLKAMFAQYSWAPTEYDPYGTGAGGRSSRASATGADGEAGGEARAAQPSPEEFAAMADSLQMSVERLRAYYSQMDWVPGGHEGVARPQRGAAGTPDARYFDAQADTIMASIERLRGQFQEVSAAAAAAAAARAASGAGGSGSGGDGEGGQGEGKAVVVPDARYFETQAEMIASSLDELMRLYESRRSGASYQGGGPLAPWAGGAGAAGGAGSGGAGGPGGRPDARAGDAAFDDPNASVQPLVDLFSAFLGHMSAARSAGASGPWPLPLRAGGGAGAAGQAGGEEGSAQGGGEAGGEEEEAERRRQAEELVRMFAAYARSWPSAAMAAAAARKPSGPADATGGGGRDVYGLGAGGVAGMANGVYGAGGPVFPDPLAGGAFGSTAGGVAGSSVVQQGELEIQYTPSFSGGSAFASPDALALAGLRGPAGADAAAAGTAALGGGAASGAEGGAAGGLAGDGGDGSGGAGRLLASPPSQAVRFRIAINATDASAGASPLPGDGAAGAARGAGAWGAEGELGASGTPAGLSPRPSASLPADAAGAGPGSSASTPALSARGGPSPGAAPGSARGVGGGAGGVGAGGAGAGGAGAPLDMLLASLEARHGRGLASSPEAVAVWRDLLMLLGVDPTSRPLPSPSPRGGLSRAPSTAGGAGGSLVGAAAALAGPSGYGVVTTGIHGAAGGTGGTGSTAGSAAGGWGPGGDAGAEGFPGRAAWPHGGPGSAQGGGGAGAGPGASSMAFGADAGSLDGTRGAGLGGEAGSLGGAASAVGGWVSAERSAAGAVGAAPGGPAPDGAEGSTFGGFAGYGGEASGGGAGAVGSPFGSPAYLSAGGAPPGGGAAGDAPGPLEGQGGGGDGTYQEGAGGTSGPGGSGAAGGPGEDGADGALASSRGGAAGAPAGAAAAGGGDGGGDAAAVGAPGSGDGAGGDGGELPPSVSVAAHAGYGEAELGPEVLGAADAAAAADGAAGLVAGGVRFSITLSEITPAAEAAALVQFRANVAEGASGEELEQLKQVRSSLTEQLAATQELVLHLNHQLKGVLEEREEVAARAERLVAELQSAQSATREAQDESESFMRDLVETKVQLAEVQGEYMQVYQALKRALGNEKGMMAKIDELERILAVVGPGDVAVDEEGWGSAGVHGLATRGSLGGLNLTAAIKGDAGGGGEAGGAPVLAEKGSKGGKADRSGSGRAKEGSKGKGAPEGTGEDDGTHAAKG